MLDDSQLLQKLEQNVLKVWSLNNFAKVSWPQFDPMEEDPTRIWERPDYRVLLCVPAASTAHNGCVNGMRFTSDGLYLVSFGSDNALRLWDTASGKNTLVSCVGRY